MEPILKLTKVVFKIARGKEKMQIKIHLDSEKMPHRIVVSGPAKLVQDFQVWAKKEGYLISGELRLDDLELAIMRHNDFQLIGLEKVRINPIKPLCLR